MIQLGASSEIHWSQSEQPWSRGLRWGCWRDCRCGESKAQNLRGKRKKTKAQLCSSSDTHGCVSELFMRSCISVPAAVVSPPSPPSSMCLQACSNFDWDRFAGEHRVFEQLRSTDQLYAFNHAATWRQRCNWSPDVSNKCESKVRDCQG